MKITAILYFLCFTNIVYCQKNGLYEFQNKSKYGFMDKKGNVIVKPDYLHITKFSNGLAFVANGISERGYKWICIDTLGNKIFDIGDDLPEGEFSEGFALISGLNKSWFINKKGEEVFNKTWKDNRGKFKNGIAIVSDVQFGESYYINTKGDKISNLPIGHICEFNEGLAVVCNKKCSLIDSLGNIIFEDFESFGGINDGLIKIKKNYKWGFIDRKGNIQIDFLYEEDRDKRGDKYFKRNIDSLDALPKSRLRNIGLFHNELVSFQRDSLWGFLNKNNEIIIEPKYKKVQVFSEEIAGVSLDGIKWGFIDKKSNVIIEPKYYLVDKFENGICAVRFKHQDFIGANDYWFDALINKKGDVINKVEMHCFMGFENDLIRYYGGFHFTGGVHYINKQGETVLPKL